MATHNLTAKARTETGKNQSYRIRQTGNIPAVVYSHGKSEIVQVDSKEFNALFKSGHISESMVIQLSREGKDTCPVFVKDYQANPVTDVIEHIDFYEMHAGEKVQTMISIKYEGNPIGVREGGVLEISDRELEVTVLPTDLVEEIVIDISALALGEGLHISEVKRPESMTFLLPADHVIAHVAGAKNMEEENVAEVEEAATDEATEE